MIIAQFDNIPFGIQSGESVLFNGLKMSAECDTNDAVANAQGYVTAKNGKPMQVSFSAIIHSAISGDVETQMLKLLDSAQRSQQGYFYVGGRKLFPFSMMAVKADTEETVISPSGKMIQAKVAVTLKQASAEWISAPEVPANVYTGKESAYVQPPAKGIKAAGLAGVIAGTLTGSPAGKPSTAQVVADQIALTQAAKAVPSIIQKTAGAAKTFFTKGQ